MSFYHLDLHPNPAFTHAFMQVLVFDTQLLHTPQGSSSCQRDTRPQKIRVLAGDFGLDIEGQDQPQARIHRLPQVVYRGRPLHRPGEPLELSLFIGETRRHDMESSGGYQANHINGIGVT